MRLALILILAVPLALHALEGVDECQSRMEGGEGLTSAVYGSQSPGTGSPARSHPGRNRPLTGAADNNAT